MRFVCSAHSKRMNGIVQYIPEESSFITDIHSPLYCSIVLGDTYVGLDLCSDKTTICSISGFSPSHIWRQADIAYPNGQANRLMVDADCFVMGCGYPYGESWKTCYDPKSKIVMFERCKNDFGFSGKQVYIQFLDNATALLEGDELMAIYIKEIYI